MKSPSLLALACVILGLSPALHAQAPAHAPMLRGDTAATSNGWTTTGVLTVGDTQANGYQPPGVLDGIGAFPFGPHTAALLVNHELYRDQGKPYLLANGTSLTGARMSYLIVERKLDAQGQPVVHIISSGSAIQTIHDRSGAVVTSAAQVNETGSATAGFTRFCSGHAINAGTFGFVDYLYFSGEEAHDPAHPHGGTAWVLDALNLSLWAAPALGRGAWENVAPITHPDPNKVALVLGNDTEAAPLFLYVGTKNALGDGSLLDRNGLAAGKLYTWKTDNGDTSPQAFHGLDARRTGHFVELAVKDPTKAGQSGYDAAGYANASTLIASAQALGCFTFSRTEDVSTNPYDATQVAFTSTGRGALFPADNWGTVFVASLDPAALTGELVIVHDADGLAIPDSGVRSPDNIEWARDGKLYVQEDRAVTPSSLFGAATGIETSLWRIDPVTRAYRRIAEVDRTALAPLGVTDASPTTIGVWETSGVLDVSPWLGVTPGERVLVATVQAHSLKDGPIGGSTGLVEGGQLLLITKPQ